MQPAASETNPPSPPAPSPHQAATSPTSPPAPSRWRVKVAALLGAVCAVGAAAVIPYQLALLPAVRAELPLPVPLVALVSALQSGVLFGLLAWAGLRLGASVGLGAPRLEAWAQGAPGQPLDLRALGQSFGLGFALTAVVSVVDVTWVLPAMPPPLAPLPTVGPGLGLLASIYGTVNEEVLLRLFFTTALVWLAARVFGRGDAGPPAGVYVSCIVLAAVLFGVGHLPIAAKIWALTPGVVARVVLLNATLGVAFGWLYWRRGLEHAMVAHFAADLVLHVAAPLLGVGP